MQINMDKYKTSQLGQALKKVYRGEMKVEASVQLAETEIAEVFNKKENDREIGFVGDTVGRCPLCGREIRRVRRFYGCSGYREGCKFSVNTVICGKTITVSLLKQLLENGITEVLHGFVSPKSGKKFDAALRLENGRTVFDFSQRNSENDRLHAPSFSGEEPPLPEPPPEY